MYKYQSQEMLNIPAKHHYTEHAVVWNYSLLFNKKYQPVSILHIAYDH